MAASSSRGRFMFDCGQLHEHRPVRSSSGGLLEVAADAAANSQIDFLGASQLTIDNAALFGTGVGGIDVADRCLKTLSLGAQSICTAFGDWAALLYNPAERSAPDH